MAITVWAAGDQVLASAINTNFNETIFSIPAYVVDAGAFDAYAASASPAPSALTAGLEVCVNVNTANTGSATFNLNAFGAKTIKKYANGIKKNLDTGDLIVDQPITLRYDGTDWVLMSPPASADAPTGFMFELLFNSASSAIDIASCGFSDASPDLIAVGVHQGTTDLVYTARIGVSPDVGYAVYPINKSSSQLDATSTAATTHPLYIGTDVWIDDATTNVIDKNGTAVTISGTARHGALGHDATNGYLLILYSTTKIAKFTGIAGTTITNASADVTLDTAVSQIGFVFDDLNDQYVCVDTTANLLRKFDSVGTTIETVSYTVDDTSVRGVCLIKDRYYLVITVANSMTGINQTALTVAFVPTNMRRG